MDPSGQTFLLEKILNTIANTPEPETLSLPPIVVRPVERIGFLDPAYSYSLPHHHSLRLVRTRADFVISEEDMDSILIDGVEQR